MYDSIRPVSLTITTIDAPADFAPNYTSEMSQPDGLICTTCADAGWYAPAHFVVVSVCKWYGEAPISGTDYACDKHVVDHVENFRDTGR